MLNVLIAIAIGVLIWRASMWMIRVLATPPPELDPSDVVEVSQDFRCNVCGAEVTLKMLNVEEPKPPRHCREDMVPVAPIE